MKAISGRLKRRREKKKREAKLGYGYKKKCAKKGKANYV